MQLQALIRFFYVGGIYLIVERKFEDIGPKSYTYAPFI